MSRWKVSPRGTRPLAFLPALRYASAAMPDTDSVNDLVERGREAPREGRGGRRTTCSPHVEPTELSPADLELIAEATSWTGPPSGASKRPNALSAATPALEMGQVPRALRWGSPRLPPALGAGAVAAGWAKRAERCSWGAGVCRARTPRPPTRPRRERTRRCRRGRGAPESSARDRTKVRRQRPRGVDTPQSGIRTNRRRPGRGGLGADRRGGRYGGGGRLRPTATGNVYCWTITTCRDLQEVRRAGEWTARFEQWCERTSLPGGWRGDCRVHRAEVLSLHGRWAEAEAEAESAWEDFLAFNMPGEAGQATNELGEIHLRRGDLGGAAAAFRPAVEAGWDPRPGLALLRLAEGKPASGFRAHARARRCPDDRIERARLLPALVELAVAAEQSRRRAMPPRARRARDVLAARMR